MATQTGFDEATTAINLQIQDASDRAGDTISRAFDAINNLSGVAGEVPPFIDFIAPSIGINIPIVSGTGPSRPDAAIAAIVAAIGAAPGDFAASIDDRAMQDAPQEQFSTPVINFPTAPLFVDLVPPSALNISLPNNFPVAPTVNLPSDLTVGQQVIPNVPSVSLPDFGESLPTLSIDLPDTTFAYVEPTYTSALKTAIAAALLIGVEQGGTGLNATIETNIWNRQIERLNQQKDDDVEKTLAVFAGRGFDLPTGMVAMQVQEVQNKHSEERAQASRDVAIEQARIAKDMTQFFLTSGLNLEQLELNHANNIANRALDAEKSVVQFSIDLFNAKVSKFNLQLERYKANQIEVEAKLKIQELVLVQYRAELEGVDIGVKQDALKIDNYRALLSSHGVNIDLYQAQVAAVDSQLNIERAKVEIFKGEIDAYVAQIQAKKSEYDLYLAQIEGERAKIDIFSKEVDAYATRVNAVKVSNDVVVAQITSDIAVEEMNLKGHLANVDLYKTKSDLAVSRINEEADLYRTDSGVFDTLIRHANQQAELNVQTQIRTESLIQANANMSLQASIANLNALLESNRIRVTASTAQASASSALAGMVGSAIQGMLQLGGQGTALETTEITP